MDYTHGSTAITLFNYPKDSGRIIVCNGEPSRLLPTQSLTLPPPTASLQKSVCSAGRDQRQAVSFNFLAVIDMQQCGSRSYPPRPSEGSFLLSPSPTHHEMRAGREGSRETSLKRPPPPRLEDAVQHEPGNEILAPRSPPCFQGRLEEQHQTSADTGNYIQIADTRSAIDLFLEGRTSYPVKRGVTLLNSERIITQHEGHSCYWYTSGFVSESDREQRSAEHFTVRRQA